MMIGEIFSRMEFKLSEIELRAIKTRLTCTLQKLRVQRRVTATDQRPDYR